MGAESVLVKSHDIAVAIDPGCNSIEGAGYIETRVRAVVIEKSVRARAGLVNTDNLIAVVDP